MRNTIRKDRIAAGVCIKCGQLPIARKNGLCVYCNDAQNRIMRENRLYKNGGVKKKLGRPHKVFCVYRDGKQVFEGYTDDVTAWLGYARGSKIIFHYLKLNKPTPDGFVIARKEMSTS